MLKQCKYCGEEIEWSQEVKMFVEPDTAEKHVCVQYQKSVAGGGTKVSQITTAAKADNIALKEGEIGKLLALLEKMALTIGENTSAVKMLTEAINARYH